MLKKKVKNDRKVKTAMSRGTALPARPAASETMSAANFESCLKSGYAFDPAGTYREGSSVAGFRGKSGNGNRRNP